jgi:hypothetical protein
MKRFMGVLFGDYSDNLHKPKIKAVFGDTEEEVKELIKKHSPDTINPTEYILEILEVLE